jgi:hypothetical protein
MNKTIKSGLIVLAVGIALNIISRLIWPPISQIPLGDPAKMPLLYVVGACVILSPLLLVIGAVLTVLGGLKSKE